MKIVFMDIDGVLNSEEWANEILPIGRERGYGGHFVESTKLEENDVGWDPECVGYLRRIVASTGAQIVISSTWRIYFSIPKFLEMFAFYGWNNPPIIDKTIQLGHRRGVFYEYTTRGLEVAEWLNGHEGIESYVILDDYNQFLPDQQSNLVKTSPLVGLDEKDTELAIKILNRPL